MLITIVSFILVVILCFIYFKTKYNEHYWKKRGVVMYEKHKTGGPFTQYILEDKSFFQLFKDIYNNHENEPAVGLGSLLRPTLFVKDPTNIQHVLIADFDSFNHRGLALSDSDILSNNLMLLYGPKWKLIRKNMSPIFTTAKLRNMYCILDKCAQDFINYLRLHPQKLQKDSHNTLSFFSTAAISAAVFGIDTESTIESPFQSMVKDALASTLWKNVKFSVAGVSDWLFKVMGFKLFGDHEDFFVASIKQVIKKRKEEGVNKFAFADICVELQKAGKMIDKNTGLQLEPTDELFAAQAFFFFLAGVETSATAIFGALVELGRHPEVLNRLQSDIDVAFEEYDRKLTYDAIVGMNYLGKVLDESLRLHPPIGYLTRRCVRNTVLPVGNIHVEKDTNIFIPIYDLHHDSKYFPNPEVFEPERFKDGKIANDFAYMPFGKGNRHCFGQRYARLKVLSVIAHLLRHFTVKTHVHDGGIKYKKEQMQVKLKNVDVELIPRM